jgi:hypothetical protein
MTIPSLPANLKPDLSGREAIADAVYRCVTSFDTEDEALFKSAFTSDAVFELNGTVMNGLEAIHAQCYGSVSKLDTTHFLTNLRINILEEDSKARSNMLSSRSTLPHRRRYEAGYYSTSRRLLILAGPHQG